MTPVLLTYFTGAALSLIGIVCLLSSFWFSAPGVRRPWSQLWAPADSFVGPGRLLNRGGFGLTVLGVVIVMAALAWHHYQTYGFG